MSSLRRQIASRANGARSRGPVTPQGKARSADNAIRHGILARCIVIRGESRDAFQELMNSFVLRFQPSDEIEMNLVEEMAAAVWRTRRFWAIETRLLDDAIAAAPPNDSIGRMAAGFSAVAAGPQLGLLNRYETRLHRIYQRAFDNLLLLQAERNQSDQPEATDEAGTPIEPPLSEQLPSAPRSEERGSSEETTLETEGLAGDQGSMPQRDPAVPTAPGLRQDGQTVARCPKSGQTNLIPKSDTRSDPPDHRPDYS
jgi:hypothetical protein